MKLDLKIIENRLVIDLGKMKEDYSESYGYDGLPSFYDIGELGCAEIVAQVEISRSQMDVIMAEYEGGGECDWCEEVAKELSGPPWPTRGQHLIAALRCVICCPLFYCVSLFTTFVPK